MNRLWTAEGLRGLLAFWVLVCHVLWASGVYQNNNLPILPRLLRDGAYAVDVFIILSGFVIFMLLDRQRETYREFIVRRFFRLFPLFAALFFIAIPLSKLTVWNATHATQYLSPEQINFMTGRVESWWNNLHWQIPLHLLMLHGAVPQTVLKDSPDGFLAPAWSISLEWQFYLIAPLAFALVVGPKSFRRIGICAACALLVVAARYVFPPVPYDAALPFHLEFFFLGAVSYFVYKHLAGKVGFDTSFPVACSLGLFILILSGKAGIKLVPLVLWMIFLGLILEHPSSLSSRLVSPLFTNPFIQYLGRISYSIYLSHMLLMVVVQNAILNYAPHLSQATHFWVLLAGTIVATIGASTVLYRFVEIPGIQAGRSLALWLSGSANQGSEEVRTNGRIAPFFVQSTE